MGFPISPAEGCASGWHGARRRKWPPSCSRRPEFRNWRWLEANQKRRDQNHRCSFGKTKSRPDFRNWLEVMAGKPIRAKAKKDQQGPVNWDGWPSPSDVGTNLGIPEQRKPNRGWLLWGSFHFSFPAYRSGKTSNWDS